MLKILAIFFLTLGGTVYSAELRQTVNINQNWKFLLGDHQGSEVAGYDDAAWDAISLPHSFSIPYFGSPRFYTGYGWYRKHFEAPPSWNGQRIFVEFDGVFQVAEVFVNGQSVGQHRGGYTGFSLDITAATRIGADNVIAVRVNNLWNPRLAPRAGEHVFSGGIYRDVRLVVTNPLHVAWYGTFVTTPNVSRTAGNVNAKTEIANDSSLTKATTVNTALIDANGNLLTSAQSTLVIPAGKSVIFDQTSAPIPNPKLWSPDHPTLYTIKTTVLDNGKPVDEFTTPFGFRWFTFTADQGFFLNGEHVYLRGANVHQDHAGWGDAVSDAGLERDAKMVKNAGFNFVRGSHYPRNPAFSEACDKLGILLWSENAFWGMGGFKPDGYWDSSAYPPKSEDQPEFEASVKQQLWEMIRIHRNHPSIIVWSMGNEVFFSEDSVLPELRQFLAELVAYTHELDATRPAGIGGAQRPLDGNRIDKIGDVAGYNGDGATIPIFQNPGTPNLVSEYGSTAAKRPGDYAPGWGLLAKDDGKPVWDWRSGQAIWCMFDHGSIGGENLERMGIVDYFRIPKRAWYWYRNEYKHIPPPSWPTSGTPAKLRLEADKTVLNSVDGTDDVYLLVTVLDAQGRELSNSVPVTLDVVSGPGEFPTGPSITFEPGSDIAILDGKAAIEFRTYYSGRLGYSATSPGLTPAEITIVSHGEPRWIEGVTPAVKPRPYTRFTQASQPVTPTTTEINLAANRPTDASSNAPNSSSANITDGKVATVWKAAGNDSAPWVQVDLESSYLINSVTLTFPNTGEYQYRIAVSPNGTDWKTVGNVSRTSNTAATCTITGNFGPANRFLRLYFTKWPEGQVASLAEIAVTGVSK